MRLRLFVLGATLVAAPAAAQSQTAAAAAPSPGPALGAIAPDFTAPGATRYGVLRDGVRLADYRGQTVVLAFFPKARTQGCTVQMEAYRDQYASLFNDGRKVTVIGISADADTTQASWARDGAFPMVFASDVGGAVGSLYGAYSADNKIDSRLLFVIGPDGRIAYKATPFRAMSPAAYTELGAAVDRISPPAPGSGDTH